MIAFNRTRGKVLGERIEPATTFLKRALGLLGRKSLRDGEGMWIAPCRLIHTFGMSFPIDVLFIDKEGRVLGLHRNLSSGRISRYFPKAAGVLELPSEVVHLTGTAEGDLIEFVSEA